MLTFFRKKSSQESSKRFSKKSFFSSIGQKLSFGKKSRFLHSAGFYFGLMPFVLFGLLFFSSASLAEPNYGTKGNITFFNSFFKNPNNLANTDLFFGQNKELALETPDLKIIQDNSLYAVSTPSVLTTQTLGDVFGSSSEQRQEVQEYTVQIGDTVKGLADKFGISENTIAWANNISKNATLKVGQALIILPVSGVNYIVKSGDTVSQLAKTYKAKEDDIITFNGLASASDIFIGDSLIIPDGAMPQKVVAGPIQVVVPDSFFIFPVLKGLITQGLHYYNGIDVANSCGTPIYATASGLVQRAVGDGGYHAGMGNHVSILHPNGTVTYYGHLMTVFVRPGDNVVAGSRIGLMGKTGRATGCHVHYEVIGARNPLARYGVGTTIDANKQ